MGRKKLPQKVLIKRTVFDWQTVYIYPISLFVCVFKALFILGLAFIPIANSLVFNHWLEKGLLTSSDMYEEIEEEISVEKLIK